VPCRIKYYTVFVPCGYLLEGSVVTFCCADNSIKTQVITSTVDAFMTCGDVA
jgi:hypothetical protein